MPRQYEITLTETEPGAVRTTVFADQTEQDYGALVDQCRAYSPYFPPFTITDIPWDGVAATKTQILERPGIKYEVRRTA